MSQARYAHNGDAAELPQQGPGVGDLEEIQRSVQVGEIRHKETQEEVQQNSAREEIEDDEMFRED